MLSDEGQAIWANAYLRPVRASAMTKEAAAKFLPAVRVRARQGRRLREDGGGAEGVHRPLPEGSPVALAAHRACDASRERPAAAARAACARRLRGLLAAADGAPGAGRRERAARHRGLRRGRHRHATTSRSLVSTVALSLAVTIATLVVSGDRRRVPPAQRVSGRGAARRDADVPARLSRRGRRASW